MKLRPLHDRVIVRRLEQETKTASGIFIPDNAAEQAEVALANIDDCLRAAGARAEHVVKVNVYLTDIGDRGAINPVRQRYFGEHRPASTLVGVAALVLPALKVEIEAQAVIP